MKIHELAHLSGVNPETIRMYRQKGLLHPARLANGYFDYSACNLYELMFVPFRLPPRGMYTYSLNQVPREICHRRQNSVILFEIYG